jgi:hypothetical protein
MKKILLVILLIAVTATLCVLPFVVHPASRNLIAKIRYFDGSMDTISITGYSPVGGSIRLKAEDGHIAVIGANNVMIIEDEDY